MTEKQKMLMGILYQPKDERLAEERRQAKRIIGEYREAGESKENHRMYLIRELLGSAGEEIYMEAPFHFDYGYRVQIGENFFSNVNFTVMDGGGVVIGDNVSVGPNVGIYTVQQPTDVRRRVLGYEWAMPVTIGNNVSIGGDVTILPGVTIGDNVTIGGGSVVVKDIPSDTIAAGNPCTVIKNLE